MSFAKYPYRLSIITFCYYFFCFFLLLSFTNGKGIAQLKPAKTQSGRWMIIIRGNIIHLVEDYRGVFLAWMQNSKLKEHITLDIESPL